MDPKQYYDQLLAQQRQAMQNYYALMIVFGVICLVLSGVGWWVIYMFYARLRGIEDEVRKFRIAYEFAKGR
jgi:hypothetical protein